MTTLQIQALLIYHGFDPGTPDGIMGKKTAEAVRQFQTRVGLTADGAPGELTQKALRTYMDTPLPEKPAESQHEAVTEDNHALAGHPPWWRTIKHFTPMEMRCPCGKCGGFPKEPEEKLMHILDDIREHFGVPVTIVPLPPNNPHAGGSGVRCQAYNDSLSGSVPNSRHVQGKAADIIVRGFSGSAVEAYCQSLVKQGRLRYCYVIGGGDSVHIDIL